MDETGATHLLGAQRLGSGGAGGKPLMTSLPVDVPEQMANYRKEADAVRSAGDQVGNQQYINRQILNLSKDTKTGPGTPIWQQAMGGASSMWGGTQQVNNYQELGKYLEKNAISAMTAMGGTPSDARLSAATAANGSTEFNPRALQEVTKYNDAANTALGQYRTGIDKAVGVDNSNPRAMPAFKSAWAQNLDPNVFRAENAIRDGDTMELQRLKTELGPKGMALLAQKRKNLNSLATTGRLP
jgi:hypothetical protein